MREYLLRQFYKIITKHTIRHRYNKLLNQVSLEE